MADVNSALRKLQSGQTLTPDEQKILGITPANEMSNTQMTSSGVAPSGTVNPMGAGPILGSNNTSPTGVPAGFSTGFNETVDLTAANAARLAAEEKFLAGKSAYDILYNEFKKYGLESLVTPLKGFIQDGFSEAEFTLKLRDTDAYKKRFAANAKRIANGFAAIDEATYLGLEDRYQSIMQNYGMPAKYYTRGELGVQQYFEDAISNNVDPVTFEERIMEGKKVIDANKTTLDAIKQFYPSLNDGDFLSYVLDSKNAISDIQRKVTSAEIGGAQLGAGLGATFAGAEALAKAGITGKQYQQAAPTIAGAALRGGQLASIYGEDPYTQQTAEQFVLDMPGSTDALKKTQKIAGLEQATFGKKTGISSSALSRDRAGAY